MREARPRRTAQLIPLLLSASLMATASPALERPSDAAETTEASMGSSGRAITPGKIKAIIADPKGPAAPGCTVGAFRDGKPLLVTAAGAADIAAKRPLDGDTLFYAASISKQFTALAIAKLVEQGKIALDDDVRKYLPELPEYQQPITVHMLMLHTAGIRDWPELSRLAGISSAAETSKAAALQLLFAQKNTDFTPGTAWSYSNGGYLLLAEIVERAAGMPFADYMKRTILQPLGMKHSFFLDGNAPRGPKVAHGYLPIGERFDIRDTYPRFGGSGGLMISINDLARYERDLAAGSTLWTPVVRKIMLTPGRLTDGEPAFMPSPKQSYGGGTDRAYAGGLLIGRRNGQYFIEHGGGAEAFRGMYARLPERKLAVVILCNRGDWNPQAKADAIIEAIEGNILTTEAPGRVVAPGGRYVSGELRTSYDLTLTGNELTAKIASPYADAAGSALRFRRLSDGSYESADGTYQTEGMKLRFDADGQGFTILTDHIRALHFERAR